MIYIILLILSLIALYYLYKHLKLRYSPRELAYKIERNKKEKSEIKTEIKNTREQLKKDEEALSNIDCE